MIRSFAVIGIIIGSWIALTPLATVACPFVPGDVAPGQTDESREPPLFVVEGDGDVNVGDVIVALKASADLLELTWPTELRSCGVPGDLAPGESEGRVLTTRGDLEVTVGDVVVLLRASADLLDLRRPERVLSPASGSLAALVDSVHLDAVVVDPPFDGPAEFSISGHPTASISGSGTWSVRPETEGPLALTLVASSAGEVVEATVTLQVGIPAEQASGTLGPEGGELSVTEAGSPILGTTLSAPPGALAGSTSVSLATVPDPAPWSARATSLGPSVLVRAGDGSGYTATLPFDASAIPPGSTRDDVVITAWSDRASPGACTVGSPYRPRWLVMPARVDDATDTATVELPAEDELILKAWALAEDAECGWGDAAGGPWELILVDCPVVSLETASAALNAAKSSLERLGFSLPSPVHVVFLDWPAPCESGFVNVGQPDVVYLHHLTSDRTLRATTAHELFHLAQLNAMGPASFSAAAEELNRNTWLLEGTADWFEELTWDADDPYDGHAGRIFRLHDPSYATVLEVDDLTDLLNPHRAFGLFNYLDTTHGLELRALFNRTPEDLDLWSEIGGAARIVDRELREAAGVGLDEAFLDFVWQYQVGRDPGAIDEIDRWWGFTHDHALDVALPLDLETAPPGSSACHPLELHDLRYGHPLTGTSAVLAIPAGGVPAEEFVVRIRFCADVDRDGDFAPDRCSSGVQLPCPGSPDEGLRGVVKRDGLTVREIAPESFEHDVELGGSVFEATLPATAGDWSVTVVNAAFPEFNPPLVQTVVEVYWNCAEGAGGCDGGGDPGDPMPSDLDGDGIADEEDNCPAHSNPFQENADGSCTGDACEWPFFEPLPGFPVDSDADCDGIPGLPTDLVGLDSFEEMMGEISPPAEPCFPFEEAPRCDGGAVDCIDNCPEDWNPSQVDSGGNVQGDACEPCLLSEQDARARGWHDLDGDGLFGLFDAGAGIVYLTFGCDNCPDHFNPDQVDTDRDGFGDVCDSCPDRRGEVHSDFDGIADACDPCPFTDDPAQELDSDEDGIGDACDACPFVADRHDDTVECDGRDGVLTPEPAIGYPWTGEGPCRQCDSDGDGVGDACDSCVMVWNPGDLAGLECETCTVPGHDPEGFDCNGDGDTDDLWEGWGHRCDEDRDGTPDACQ